MATKPVFTFEISLSVLNHLGRNLYRSFTTVLGEAISNAWDADAENVWIFIDKKTNSFVIKDDGIGMSKEDFQDRFLKIGYSKRKDGGVHSQKGRPYIGRKGIGKLALLSCSENITVISKTEGKEYIGGVIDNSDLDKAITDDLTPKQYPLKQWNIDDFSKYTNAHNHGTIIYFDHIKDGIRNTLEYLKKTVALYFKFSLLDKSFNIFIEGEKITLDHLSELANNTEFCWKINNLFDPYIDDMLKCLKEPIKPLKTDLNIKGFIASVELPSNLKIIATDERVSVDLFVNGRLRERDILKHIPSARIVENYLYGQIHYDALDDEIDRFTSSRESIVSDDPKYKSFLDSLKKSMTIIIEDWDIWRNKHNKDGDPENKRLTKKARKSRELFYAVADDYSLPKDSDNRKKVKGWVTKLSEDASYNFESYADCFISENLVRNYINDKALSIAPELKNVIQDFIQREADNKQKGNINIDLRQLRDELSYLDMLELSKIADKQVSGQNCLPTDARQYKPIRDALMHTALLTNEAKRKLTAVYENIRGRIIHLLSI